MDNNEKTIAVIGAGAWGTALSQNFASAEKDTTLWARESEVVTSLQEKNENSLFLPGFELSSAIKPTSDLSEAVKADILLIVVPAQYLRSTLKSIKPHIDNEKPIVICSKGIEVETGLLLSRVCQEEMPENPVAVLTGPTFASEIVQGLPSAMTLACETKEMARLLRESLNTKKLRIYITDDVLGTQLGGAVKNVIAIGCGIIHGLGFGESARAALVTRGLAETGRLASAIGANKTTLMGMCGVGDLMLTCSSMQSRNFSLGYALGSGETLNEILAKRNSVTEGVHTAKALITLAKNNAVEMPISEGVHDCLSGEKTAREIVDKILERPLRDAI